MSMMPPRRQPFRLRQKSVPSRCSRTCSRHRSSLVCSQARSVAITSLAILRKPSIAIGNMPGMLQALAKWSAVNRLDELLPLFVTNFEAGGGIVHFARDAQEARTIIVDLVRASNAKAIIKSKCMTTEEIHLNDALEKEGYVVVESDLGNLFSNFEANHLTTSFSLHACTAGRNQRSFSKTSRHRTDTEPRRTHHDRPQTHAAIVCRCRRGNHRCQFSGGRNRSNIDY